VTRGMGNRIKSPRQPLRARTKLAGVWPKFRVALKDALFLTFKEPLWSARRFFDLIPSPVMAAARAGTASHLRKRADGASAAYKAIGRVA